MSYHWKYRPDTIPEAMAELENSDHIAVICGTEELTYRQLLADVRHAAHALMGCGVQKGDRVVLNMGRSTDYVRICFGIIFAGAIQVTPYKGWPEEQRAMVISDCDPVLTVDDALARELMTTPLAPEAAIRPLPGISGSDPFQIVYTSGSTGVPKGSVNTHLMPMVRLIAKDNEWQPCEMDSYSKLHCERFLLDANLAFNLAFGLYMWAFTSEKTVVLATEDDLSTPAALAACIKRNKVDHMIGIPSLYYSYLSDPDFADALSGIKVIELLGEHVGSKMMDEFLKYSNIRFCCLYGQTETWLGMFSTQLRKGKEVLYDHTNTEMPVYLLEEGGMAEVPAGTEGEICVGGPPGQHAYYWNDPDLTAKKYCEHSNYGRLFRSGDLGKREADGRLRLLGRMDGMAKLHGMRIELGAIEGAIEAFPGVHRAAVKIWGEGPDAVLCGYYSGSVDQGALRRRLAEALPYYMVPALMRELPELPLLINGKLDRRSLPPIQGATGEYAPPGTESEKLLCEAFAQVLESDTPIGIDDSFLEIGGDSIRALAVGELLRDRGYQLKVEWIFAAPTVRALAPMLLKAEQETYEDETLWMAEINEDEWKSIDQAVGRENVEAVYPALLLAKEFAGESDPCWVFETYLVSSNLTVEELCRNLSESVRCHQMLRTVYVCQGTKRPLQVVLHSWTIPVFSVDLRRLAKASGNGEELSEAQIKYLTDLSRLYRNKPFSNSEVMFDAGLIRISDDISVLVLAYSHLLLDGAGKICIWNELIGAAPAASDVKQYNRYMRLLCTWKIEEGCRTWREELKGRPALTGLTAVPDGMPGMQERVLIAGQSFSEEVHRFCSRNHVTVSSLTCLALGRAMMEETGLKEVSFMTMSSGRDLENIRLSGMFACSFPIFVKKNDTLASLQEQLVRAARHPVVDMEEADPGFIRNASGYPVTLSMQNYMRAPSARIRELPLFTFPAASSWKRESGHEKPFRKNMGIVVFPDSPFIISILYDGMNHGRAAAESIGRKLLAEMRKMIEEEK